MERTPKDCHVPSLGTVAEGSLQSLHQAEVTKPGICLQRSASGSCTTST
jgi:hypothetical protein